MIRTGFDYIKQQKKNRVDNNVEATTTDLTDDSLLLKLDEKSRELREKTSDKVESGFDYVTEKYKSGEWEQTLDSGSGSEESFSPVHDMEQGLITDIQEWGSVPVSPTHDQEQGLIADGFNKDGSLNFGDSDVSDGVDKAKETAENVSKTVKNTVNKVQPFENLQKLLIVLFGGGIILALLYALAKSATIVDALFGGE